VILSPHAIVQLAGRIERAYGRRHRHDSPWSAPDARLWELAARALIEAHRAEPWLPLDPELFVISQPVAAILDDPWQELAASEAIRRYRRRVRRLVRNLRRELAAEVRRAESRVRRGKELEVVVRRPTARVSALGAYIVAIRAGRPELAEPLVDAVHAQHAACPLYRQASRGYLPASAYPVMELLPGLVPARRHGPLPRGDGVN
jgi:hypothetical protein